ncbi:MAG: F0F1 ATP synthase subunit alpha [Planctomycetota bacterium]|nr:F0F1 ATP synthase subunit alpha [Planctomycetota bacterium]MDI6787855.1 F0F1 ATP synthase subunit alpha [Planctomycetota bacterium]
MPELVEIREVGTIKDVKRGIARIEGLSSCINSQMVHFASGSKGIIIGFNEQESFALVMGDETSVSSGEEVTSKIEPFRVPVGHGYLGRIVNALSEPIDNKGPIKPDDFYPIFREALGVIDRLPVDTPLETGVKIIDLVIPIGRGQRELIIGDRMTGKTTLVIDAIINQKGKDVLCIYCCIGRSQASLLNAIQTLQKHGAMDYTIICSAAGADSANAQYIAPYTACALGEYLMFQGKNVFVAFDDLTRHGWAYRQISLLLERAPGREAYPGDIFYIHSQMMERAGKLHSDLGGGSMTFLPIIETIQGDFTGYISTNLVSITDGQIYLSTSLFYEGFKPAIDLGLSISRVGSKAQFLAIKEVSKNLRLEYVQYRELLKLTRLRTRYSPEVETRLKRGQILTLLLTQDKNKPLVMEEQTILFYAFKIRILDLMPIEEVSNFKANITGFIKTNYPQIVEKIRETKKLTPEISEALDKALMEFFKRGR